MKTKLFILLSFCSISFASSGQDSCDESAPLSNEIFISPTQILDRVYKIKTTKRKLFPVFFSYSRRKLIMNGEKISGDYFLNFCRNINDSCIQEQVRIFDQLTTNKKWILNSTILCGVNTFVMVCASSSTVQNASGFCAACAFGSIVAAGVTAICSSIPHQKRKLVVFHDLPIAYNNYVEKNHR